jgi:hypothetical protein
MNCQDKAIPRAFVSGVGVDPFLQEQGVKERHERVGEGSFPAPY